MNVRVIDSNPRRNAALKEAQQRKARARRGAGHVDAQSRRYRMSDTDLDVDRLRDLLDTIPPEREGRSVAELDGIVATRAGAQTRSCPRNGLRGSGARITPSRICQRPRRPAHISIHVSWDIRTAMCCATQISCQDHLGSMLCLMSFVCRATSQYEMLIFMFRQVRIHFRD